MTAFNSAQRIMSAIQSLLNQTYRNIELVVIDDASNDTTGQIVQNMATQDHRIRFLRLPRNVGTYVAKNIGLEYATGEFVTCHDSDDWAHPLKIERQVAPLLADSKLVFTTSYWVRMQDDGIYYARPVYPLMRLNPASPLFRKQQVLELAGAWDPVRTGADSEFLARLKLVFGPQRMKRIMQPLTLGSHHPDSLMTAQKTGYNADGMSPSRLAYWESWNRWHVDRLRTKRIPKLEPFTSSTRSFLAPQEIQVPFEDIDYCVQQIRKKNG
jgi:glycosyltransferase involved in cell wall biosynthesis